MSALGNAIATLNTNITNFYSLIRTKLFTIESTVNAQPGINDISEVPDSTWSSQKIAQELAAIDFAKAIDDTKVNSTNTFSSQKISELFSTNNNSISSSVLGSVKSLVINDGELSLDSTFSSSRINEILGNINLSTTTNSQAISNLNLSVLQALNKSETAESNAATAILQSAQSLAKQNALETKTSDDISALDIRVNNATSKADSAVSTSSTAVNTANTAKTTADNALTSVNENKLSIASIESKVNSAVSKANNAESLANNNDATVAGALVILDSVKNKADTALTNSVEATTLANQATSIASIANNNVVDAQLNAQDAVAKAADALAKSNTATTNIENISLTVEAINQAIANITGNLNNAVTINDTESSNTSVYSSNKVLSLISTLNDRVKTLDDSTTSNDKLWSSTKIVDTLQDLTDSIPSIVIDDSGNNLNTTWSSRLISEHLVTLESSVSLYSQDTQNVKNSLEAINLAIGNKPNISNSPSDTNTFSSNKILSYFENYLTLNDYSSFVNAVNQRFNSIPVVDTSSFVTADVGNGFNDSINDIRNNYLPILGRINNIDIPNLNTRVTDFGNTLNDVLNIVGSKASLDDTDHSDLKTWSSEKIWTELNQIKTSITNLNNKVDGINQTLTTEDAVLGNSIADINTTLAGLDAAMTNLLN